MNFGRMPEGWIKSSGNNRRLVLAGKRFRGHRDASESRVPDAAAPLDLHGEPKSNDWLGLTWQELRKDRAQAKTAGLYRALHKNSETLTYVGQSSTSIAARVSAHLAKATKPGHRQARFFNETIIWEWADLSELKRTQLLEIENDLIASHMLAHDRPPDAQFLG